MLKNIARGIGFLVLSFVVGELVKRLLTSGLGRGLTAKLGHPELATHEAADEASKKAKQAIGIVDSLTHPKPRPVTKLEAQPRTAGRVRTAQDAAELLLSVGSLLRAVSGFVEEDEKLRRRIQGRPS